MLCLGRRSVEETAMARRCACEKLLELVERDPRFLLAGPAARMVFIDLVRLMARLGDSRVLQLGFVFGSWSELAFGLRISETELETHLETLCRRGIIERTEDSLTVPEQIMPRDRRADAARENGKLGGRPRKNAADPRQTNILLPIAGNGDAAASAKTQETKLETHAETLSRARLLSPEDRNSKKREETGVSVLVAELIEVGALAPSAAENHRGCEAWLMTGLSLGELREAFMATTRRAKAPRCAPIGYFTRIAEDIAGQRAAAPSPAATPSADIDPEREEARRTLAAIWDRYRNDGCAGPCPPGSVERLTESADHDLWLRYAAEGARVFRDAA
jgi:hypothetical protein